MTDWTITESQPEDDSAILAMFPRAFPDEDLTELVAALLGREDVLSLIGRRDGVIAGHALFSLCKVRGGDGAPALLGPLCVDPDHQRAGLGRALMTDGARRLAETGRTEILVLGDPDYYGRFGFDVPAAVQPPYPLKPDWAEAWRSLALGDAPRLTGGTLIPPAPWMKPAYWG